MTMIEKVARAICIANGITNPDEPMPIEMLKVYKIPIIAKHAVGPLYFWYAFEPQARAAIAALREPSREMINAGASVPAINGPDLTCGPYTSENTFKTMIDAALAEEPK